MITPISNNGYITDFLTGGISGNGPAESKTVILGIMPVKQLIAGPQLRIVLENRKPKKKSTEY